MEAIGNGKTVRAPAKKSLCRGAVLGAIIGIVAFAPVWLHHGGQYMEYGDYFLQYVPFIKELKRMVASGSLAWSWNSFLGDSFIGAYSYYTVFNPFAWFVALFPDEYILYGTMFATLIKLAISMISAMLYIRLFCRKDVYAEIGALLYTFSGFTLVNTNFYFFLDVVAIFPFLLYGLERLIQEKKRCVYIVSLLMNAAINYYFFVSSVLIIVIYVVFRLELYKPSEWKNQRSTFFRIAGYSVIGTGLASISLIPSFYAILGSGKATGTIGTRFMLMYWPQNILERIRTLVAPIESGRYHAFFDSSTWSSTGIYIPVFGCACVAQWCVQKKGWLKKICVLLTICYFIPFLNAAFNLFSSIDYTRWLYGLALLFSLATVLTLQDIEDGKENFNNRILYFITAIVAVLLLVPTAVYFLHRAGIPLTNRFASACTTEYFMGYSAIVVMLILTAINYAELWYLAKSKEFKVKNIFWCVTAACTINFCVYNALNYDLHATDYSNDYYLQKSLIEGTESTEATYTYRVDYPSQIANYGIFKNIPSTNYYNSLQNKNSSCFAEAVGIGDSVQDTILTAPNTGSEYTDALLSVKYYLDYDGRGTIPEGFQYQRTENGVDIYQNRNYIPMGFTYDSYCLEDEVTTLLPEERAQLMLNTLIIQNEDEAAVKKLLAPYEQANGKHDLSDAASQRRETACKQFLGTTKGFTATINLANDNVVFFSVPNDSGWEITVNGESAERIEVNYGLLGVVCSRGNNTIVATYHTRGQELGAICTMRSGAAWACLEVSAKKRRRSPKGEI